MYVDTDILFMRPLEEFWKIFEEFNSTQIAAVGAEHETQGAGAAWYNRFSRIPYYGELGMCNYLK